MTVANWITLGIAIGSAFFTLITRLNDLKHLEKNVDEVKKDLNSIGTKINKIDNRMAGLEAVCKERHLK